jgi:hypothetical protein
MPGIEEGNGQPPDLLLAERMLARVASLILHEDDPERLDRVAEGATKVLQSVNAQRRRVRAAQPVAPPTAPIEWLTAKELAALLHRSESHVRHLPPDAIPGRRQQARGCKVEWNKAKVLTFLAECSRQ